jgi:hypothetical protein
MYVGACGKRRCVSVPAGGGRCGGDAGKKAGETISSRENSPRFSSAGGIKRQRVVSLSGVVYYLHAVRLILLPFYGLT